ncbi:type I polyketide synthase [Streptomyces lonarensis]|uniref:SDR family NAD(P)-dependent oxidoreductase n=1 Tax=Streptomyces lonarensis TaxID=700599 RepID=A0A7X6CXX9_9ACTN|nr:type I polyketide synthase [Streptomyces lonarensis]NJQ04505.1 SDR family NAD(P)-dependent oxidoreductase [Streptomyces lonarensis]
MTDSVPDSDKDQLLRRLLLEKYEPIAVVGVGLRLPGENTTPEGFAEFLAQGGDGTGPVPADRWDTEALHSAERGTRGRITTAGGGFLRDIDRFDPQFFNIAPKEAAYVDPQQRLVLEASWHALEAANIDPAALRGSNGAVYMGVSSVDYSLEMSALRPEELEAAVGTGTAHSAVSGRLSYFLGWRGPSMSIDTACSSSLVALHLAAGGLRRGECDIALAGGVNAIHHPRNHIVFSQANMLAADGRCKTFDESADGYSRSEGVGVLVLKRLTDARRDGDRVMALVRGSAVRQDGESGGLTVPNGIAQAAVMRAALADAVLEPAEIGYVEAHGTGTSLGDPIEIGAIEKVFGASRAPGAPLPVGSVKTNIGHMEAAAGAGGVIKTVLQLRDGVFYPHLNVTVPNRHVPWDDYHVALPPGGRPWTDAPRRAVVNSFGFAGTIASVVLEQAPPALDGTDDREPAEPSATEAVLTLSARGPAALRRQAAAWRAALEDLDERDLADFCRTANLGRSHFATRVAAPVAELGQARALLDRVMNADEQRRPGAGGDELRDAPVAFLFTGQGSQYPGMGRPLYQRYPAFREQVDRLDALFHPYLGRSVRDLMFGEGPEAEADIHRTRYTQCALFTLEYALAHLWAEWGVRPNVLLGHSIGEIVAATVAGLFDLPDAVRLVAARSRLMQSVTTPGRMIAIRAAADVVDPFLTDIPDVSFAAVNAPEQCVVSGGRDSVDRLQQQLREHGLDVKGLPVSHAFHSPLMAEVFDAFRAEIADIAFREPTVSFVSNVTGRIAEYDEVATPDYWVRHIGEPVAFAAGVRTVQQRGRHVFVEVGPSGALTAMGRRSPDAAAHLWLPSLLPADTDGSTLRTALARCYTAGLAVDWAGHHRGRPGRLLDLPTYVFDTKRYWLPVDDRRLGVPGAPSPAATLLGTESTTDAQRAAGTTEFRALIGPDAPAHLADHRVMGQVVFPGAGYVALALDIQDAVLGETSRPVRQLRIHEPLFLPEGAATELRTRLTADPAGGHSVSIVSVAEGGIERLHATATLAGSTANPAADASARDARQLLAQAADADRHHPADELYADFTEVGLAYGPHYRRIERVRSRPGGLATAEIRAAGIGDGGRLHPAVLDCAMQTLAVVAPPGATYLPVAFDEVVLHKNPRGTLTTVLRLLPQENADELAADLFALEGDRPALTVRGLRLKRVTQTGAARHLVHEPRWTRRSLPAGRPAQERRVLVLGAVPAELPPAPDGVTVRTLDTAARTDGGPVPDALPADITDICWFWDGGDTAPAPDGPTAEAAALREESRRNYTALLSLLAALGDRAPRLLLVTRGAQRLPEDDATEPLHPRRLAAASLWGFGPVLLNEHPALRAALVDLPAQDSPADLAALWQECAAGDTGDHRIGLRAGARRVQRLHRTRTDGVDGTGTTVELTILDHGRFSGIAPVPVPDRAPERDEIEVRVHAAGLNFKDVLNALGMLRRHAEETATEYVPLPLGFEASGTVLSAGPSAEFAPGDEVLLSHLGCMRSRVTVPSAVAVRKPSALGFAEAAALPTAYVTAWYSLHDLAGIKPGDKVLIHAAAGGVGQAAVRIAHLAGAEVYATASPGKWPLLRQAGVRHLMNSRTLAFSEQVREATDGRGVDIVLNSLNKDYVPAGLDCLADGGRFVELGKIGIWSPERTAEYRPDVRYHNFDLSELPEAQLNRLNKEILTRVVAHIDAGDLGALPTTAYTLDETEEAFGVLSRGANVGKLVLTFPTPEPTPDPVRLTADETYLITGGLGALGTVAARRLVRDGARHLALVSRRTVDPAQLSDLARSLGDGVTVRVLTGDVADPADVARIVAEADTATAPLGGVLHAAGVLADAPIGRQDWERIDTVLRPKVYGGWLLHRATADLPGLRFFVAYSSVASVIGSVGQSNYAAANAFLDALMHERAARGLPGLSVNWGPWAEVGMAAGLTAQQIRAIEGRGLKFLTPTDGMRQLTRAWDRSAPQAVIGEFDFERLLSGPAGADAFYTAVRPRAATREDEIDLVELAALPPAERTRGVTDIVRAKVAAVLHFESGDDIDPAAKFLELGVDSLAAVELKNALEGAFRTALPTSALFDHPTVADLAGHVAARLAPEADSPETADTAQPEGPPPPAAPADLTDEQADAELAELRAQTF